MLPTDHGPVLPGALARSVPPRTVAAPADTRGRGPDDVQRARQSWHALEREFAFRDADLPLWQRVIEEGRDLLFGDEDSRWRESAGGRARPATAWPAGQVLEAALALDRLDAPEARAAMDAALVQIDGYLHDGAYLPETVADHGRSQRHVYYDDNAWIGLALIDAFEQTGDPDLLGRARDLLPLLERGMHADGGIYWRSNDSRMSRNTASNGPTLELLARLHEHTGDRRALRLATELEAAMTRELRRSDGLFRDNVGDDGTRDETLWTYNQGSPVGGYLALARVAGDPDERARLEALAVQTGRAAVEHFGDPDRLWSQPPAFTAIMFRELAGLDEIAPGTVAWRPLLDRYLDRVTRDALDPATGLHDQGGIGRYSASAEGMNLIDQAAFIQLYALRAGA